MKQNLEEGIAPITLVVAALVLIVVGTGIFFISGKKQEPVPTPTRAPSLSPSPHPTSASSLTPTLKQSPTPLTTPTCSITSNPDIGIAPLNVSLAAGASFGDVTTVSWDYDGDGKWDSNTGSSHTFTSPGEYTVKSKVKLKDGRESSLCTKTISVKVPHKVTCIVLRSDPSGGKAPFQAFYFASANFDYGGNPQGDDVVTAAQWDFNGDGNWDTGFDAQSLKTNYTYNDPGTYTAKMQARTRDGVTSDICTKDISINP